jgi:hypothetical protein
VALAALIDTGGHVLVMELVAGHTKTLYGPIATTYVRTGYGLNQVQVSVSQQPKAFQARIVVNGSPPLTYSSAIQGLQPATGIVAVGKVAVVMTSNFRLSR